MMKVLIGLAVAVHPHLQERFVEDSDSTQQRRAERNDPVGGDRRLLGIQRPPNAEDTSFPCEGASEKPAVPPVFGKLTRRNVFGDIGLGDQAAEVFPLLGYQR